ncbi:1-aminocyclopropane-1-carboxylate deaminase/D-cysteine desulfhydrase [Vibrio diabolicus]|uniref:1-aminocyclopropane-1-carboxylate deaminase/D-cysteine desulfhydrase n=1 Tax=Vibrio diabolicus TaxID=50719 RepID=UPI00211B4751|nr:pyridoxal-phosphate dependent enzyme [Vibrio diabolicus]MCG6223063.1 pyridoxal-phosphate dependent enzyme [Vibrio diabolicus]
MTPLNKVKIYGMDIYIKRDDLYPISGGGNKGRKVEYILSKCINDGCNAVVTCGGIQSNHVRATAIRCKELGIACTIVIHAPKTNNIQGNLKLLYMLGVKVVYCDMDEVAKVMDDEMAEHNKQGLKPFYIWGGGHCLEGTKAFYDAAFEVNKQSNVHFDYVFHASGTGATQAGLHLGFKIIDSTTQVVGVSIAREKSRGLEAIKHSVLDFVEINGLDSQLLDGIIFDDDFTAGGYEQTNVQQLNVIKKVASKTGIILDPTYSGKAWFGMSEYIKSGKVKPGSNVLFWHTGGLLNLMATKEI